MKSIRSLLATVIVMGILIVVATAALLMKLLGGFGPSVPHAPAPGPVAAIPSPTSLHQPAGTRILNLVPAGGMLAALLSGGGAPDRIILIDPDTGRVVEQLAAAP